MTRAIVCACLAAAGVVAAIAARAESPALNVKTGLWEMTVRLTGLTVPNDALARLPPEQRAKVEAMLGAAAQARTVKTCLTKEKLARGVLETDERHPECKRTVVSNTANTLEVRGECKLEDAAVSTSMYVEAPNPEALKGKSTIARADRPPMSSSFEGRWLGADCGDVR